jgi:hypothetical protein
MSITVSSCLVQSKDFESRPNGTLVAKGTVDYFENRNVNEVHNPVAVTRIFIQNENGVTFFESPKLSVQTLRAISKALLDISLEAEEAHKQLVKINSESKVSCQRVT